jgi:hypothetical protein
VCKVKGVIDKSENDEGTMDPSLPAFASLFIPLSLRLLASRPEIPICSPSRAKPSLRGWNACFLINLDQVILDGLLGCTQPPRDFLVSAPLDQ